MTNAHIYVEPGDPNRQGPREVNKYTQLCGALEPRMPGTPGSKQIYALTWGPRARMPGTPGGQQMYTIMGGPGAPYAREPGKSTNTRTYVGPGGPYARDRGKSTTIHN